MQLQISRGHTKLVFSLSTIVCVMRRICNCVELPVTYLITHWPRAFLYLNTLHPKQVTECSEHYHNSSELHSIDYTIN